MSEVGAVGGLRKTRIFNRLLESLLDPARRERAVLALLAAYAAVWSIYGTVAKSSQDIHFDMGEMVAWSREVTLGTPKHPPLPAWLVGAWFSVFPLTDWSYYLLAMLLATAALWIAWKVSEPYLSGEKRVIGLALLTLVPFYNFHALKFNANTIMPPLWALTTWWFLRSYETRRPIYGVLAGLAAAAAVLGKYWSIILLLGLGIAALADPRRRLYLGSPAPWLTVAVGLAGLAPHLAWLYGNGFSSFDYAMNSHTAGTVWDELISGLGYIVGAAGYLAVPVVIVLAAVRPTWSAVADTAWPREPERRLVLLAFLLPLVLPMAAAVAAGEQVVSLWSIGSMTLAPIVLLSSAHVQIGRVAAQRILMLAIAVPIAAVALSPATAIVIHQRGVSAYAAHYRLVAQAVEATWRETTDRPLRLIGSYDTLLFGTLFYFSDRPSTFEISNSRLTPWNDEGRIARDGIAMFCPVEETGCVAAMNARATGRQIGKRVEVELSRTFLGMTGAPARYMIVTIPPGIQ